jgi:hypothetical protein
MLPLVAQKNALEDNNLGAVAVSACILAHSLSWY